MVSAQEFARRIRKALSPYDSTVQALDRLIAQAEMPQEIIILACARLDSLANLAIYKGGQEQRFVRFLADYSGKKNPFLRVSVPDLYFFLQFQEWMLPGTIEKPGRIHIFTDENRLFIQVLWKTELAITLRSGRQLIQYLRRCLRAKYQVLPSRGKNQGLTHASVNAVYADIVHHAKGARLAGLRGAETEIKRMLSSFSIGRILYREYRCKAIHEYRIRVEEDSFFQKHDLYWEPVENNLISPRKFLTLAFPGRFLRDTLEACTRNLEQKLAHRRRVPMAIYDATFDFLKDLDFLDSDSIEEGKDIQLAFER